MKRIGVVAVANVALICGAWIWACDSNSLLLGNALTIVAADLVQGNVSDCASGYEHPNVCCLATGESAICGTYYPAAPFAPCPAKYFTYPDPRRCCSLDDPDPTGCVTSTTTTENTSTCFYPCAPGALESDGGACCSLADGALTCVAVPPPGDCTMPDASCTALPVCSACPSGFDAPDGSATLCCRTSETLGTECFSQAGGLRGPTITVPTVDGGSDVDVVPPPDGAVPPPDAFVSVPPVLDGAFVSPPVMDAGASPG